jgi:1-acyl-sn-glycerol-3-phosphate acyltransferase
MLYYLLKYLMRLALPIYYKRLVLSGFENIPANGPAILACNHPNAFLDAIIMGTYSPRPLHFLTRSDVFNTPLKRWILARMNMVPIYRMRDGIENLEKNQETFRKCREVLGSGGVILIFSEGLCIQELKLRPLKKGTARIALDFASTNRSLPIVPVGLNYPHARQPRQAVYVGIARPFDALDFKKEFEEHPARGIQLFNRQLEDALRTVVIDIENRQHESHFQMVMTLLLQERELALTDLIALAQRFNRWVTGSASQWTQAEVAMSRYRELLTVHQVKDQAVAAARNGWFHRAVQLFFFFPGAMLAFLPFYAVRKFTAAKVRLPEFKDSVMVAAGMVLSFVTALIWISLAWVVQGRLAVLIALLIFFSCWVAPPAFDRWSELGVGGRFARLPEAVRQALQAERRHLLQLVNANLLRG